MFRPIFGSPGHQEQRCAADVCSGALYKAALHSDISVPGIRISKVGPRKNHSLEMEPCKNSTPQKDIWLWINTYRYSLLGDEHPFATYFDVHQGYMVLTHSHI